MQRPSHRATCYACFKARVACICALVERVANRTGIIILQHPKERVHAVGSVRIARLGLERVRVESCAPWIDGAPIRTRLPARAALLYPSAGAAELTELPAAAHPRHLVLLDATWFHAKKIYDAHAWLHALPHVRLTPSAPSGYRRVRREPRPQYIGTVEAIVHALRILEPETRGLDGLLHCFAAMVDRQAAFTSACVEERISPRRRGDAEQKAAQTPLRT
jgi:DTW domain-containing protein YfiP